MRHLLYLSLLLIITGCAHNRIQYVKSGNRVIIADRTQEESEFISNDRSSFRVINETEESTNSIDSEAEDLVSVHDSENAETHEFISTEKIENDKPADTIKMSKSDYQLMIADDAEHDARRAKNLFITSLVLLILPIISIFSLIPFLIGWFKLHRSNQAQYITSEGEIQARYATILRNIYITIIAVVLMLILLLLVIFFF